ncbi:hypothetical protein E2C01_015404 [Portunus trituberculatus]|uniref:Uncharacterized protein n=1 Tax=Portunus trituberculatus TaxID=210409 RepID=A0A5B7DLJ6_PORTR|nr:hypothetical protein [Portunus trituberculatus]
MVVRGRGSPGSSGGGCQVAWQSYVGLAEICLVSDKKNSRPKRFNEGGGGRTARKDEQQR